MELVQILSALYAKLNFSAPRIEFGITYATGNKERSQEGMKMWPRKRLRSVELCLLFQLQEEQGAGLPFSKMSHNLISSAEEPTTDSPQGFYADCSNSEQPLGNGIKSPNSFVMRTSAPNLYKEHS